LDTEADAADQHSTRERVRVRIRRRRWWPRRWSRRALLLVGVILALGVADALWATVTASRGLDRARQHLEHGGEELVAGRVTAARTSFAAAREAAGEAAGFSWHPSAWVGRALPGLGDDVRAVRALIDASVLLSDAGTALSETAGQAGWDGKTVPGIHRGGEVDLEVLTRAEPGLRRAAAGFGRAEALLGPVPADGLSRRVAEALELARAELRDQARLVRSASDLARLLPSFLGADGPRRYFLGIQNLSAPRGSGGFLGHYGILEAQEGRIHLGKLAPVNTLGKVKRIQPPDPDAARYASFGGLTHFIAANYSPDFPTSARVLLDMWERKTGKPLDGMIAVDSVWMSYVLEAIGTVRTPAWPDPLTAQNIDRIANRDTFLLPQAQSNRAQGAIGAALWGALLEEPPPARGFGKAMARSIRERHLQVYARDPEEQEALRRMGAAGERRMPRFPLMVVWQDAVNSRAGYFAEKRVTHRIDLQADGSAEVLTEVTLENGAPDGPPSILLGSGKTGDPVGYFTAFVNVYLPQGAVDIRTDIDGAPALGLIEEEFGYPVVLELLGARSGEKSTLRVSYRVPEASLGLAEREFASEVIPQPALRPDLITVDVRVPPEARILGVRGLDTAAATARYEARPQAPADLAIRYGTG